MFCGIDAIFQQITLSTSILFVRGKTTHHINSIQYTWIYDSGVGVTFDEKKCVINVKSKPNAKSWKKMSKSPMSEVSWQWKDLIFTSQSFSK